MDGNGNLGTLLLIGLVIYLVMGGRLPSPAPGPSPAPAPAPVDPANPLLSFRGKPGATDVAKAHRDFAAVVARPAALYTSSGKLKADLVRFHEVLWAQTPAADTLPGFSAAFDAAFVKAFGEQDVAIDDAKATTFAETVASALGG